MSVAADSWLSGKINNITSTGAGVMIMLDTGVPTNCTGTPYGWMLIPESNKTLVATTLMAWYSGQRDVAVYSQPRVAGEYCVLWQLDPA